MIKNIRPFYIMNGYQIREAVEYYSNNGYKVDKQCINVLLVYPPLTRKLKNNPSSWSANHWKWFLKYLK